MHRLPREQQLQFEQHGLRNLPPEGLPGYDESKPREFELPTGLRLVPQHEFMAECDVQPQQHRIPADWIAHGTPTAVHRLPYQ